MAGSSGGGLSGLTVGVPMIKFGIPWAKRMQLMKIGTEKGYNTVLRNGVVQQSEPHQDPKGVWWILVKWDVDDDRGEQFLISELNKYRKDGKKWIAPRKKSAGAQKRVLASKSKAKAPPKKKPKKPLTVREQAVDSDADTTSDDSEESEPDLLKSKPVRSKTASSPIRGKKNRKKVANSNPISTANHPDGSESEEEDQVSSLGSDESDDGKPPPELEEPYETSDAGTSGTDEDSEQDGEGANDFSDFSEPESEDFDDDDQDPPRMEDWEGGRARPKLRNRTDRDLGPYLTIFMHFFLGMIPTVVEMTNRYATKCRRIFSTKNGKKKQREWKPLCKGRLLRYIAVCILMGVFRRSAKKEYFKEYSVAGVSFGSMSGLGMGLTDFEQITRYLHFTPPTQLAGADKMWKMGGLIEKFNIQSASAWELGRHVDVDEAMVPFKGRAPCKQYLPLKPKKRGLKLWCLNDSSNGYFYQINIYRGRHESSTRPSMFSVGEWAVVALVLLANLKAGTIVYCDRYFTTVKLLLWLLKRQIYCVGTAQVSKKKDTESSSGFPRKYKMKNSTVTAKGTRTGGTCHGMIAALGLQDTKVVYYLSSAFGLGITTKKVRRKQKKNGRVLKYSACAIPKFYNKFMGGTDLGDKYRAGRFAIFMFCRKWTVVVFFNLIQIILVNSFLIAKCFEPELDHHQFTIELACDMIKYADKHEKGRSVRTVRNHRDIIGRYTGRHYPEKIGLAFNSNKRTAKHPNGLPYPICRNCVVCESEGRTTPKKLSIRSAYQCNTCIKSNQHVPLCCDGCFMQYHTQN